MMFKIVSHVVEDPESRLKVKGREGGASKTRECEELKKNHKRKGQPSASYLLICHERSPRTFP